MCAALCLIKASCEIYQDELVVNACFVKNRFTYFLFPLILRDVRFINGGDQKERVCKTGKYPIIIYFNQNPVEASAENRS